MRRNRRGLASSSILFALLVNDDDDINRCDRSVRDVVAVLSIDDEAAIIVRLVGRRCPISIVPLTFPSSVGGVEIVMPCC